MISPIGFDVKTACASFRCGMNRFGPLELITLDEEEMEEVPVTGSALSGITDGYKGIALYTIIAEKTLFDLIQFSELQTSDELFWKETIIHICLSEQRNEDLWFLQEEIESELAQKIIDFTGLPIPLENIQINSSGRTALYHSVGSVAQSFTDRKCKRGIILAVDSLVDDDAVSFYSAHGRLLNPGEKNGFIPGEAGAAVMIETAQSIQSRNVEPVGYLSAPLTCKSLGPLLEEPVSYSRAISALFIESAAEDQPTTILYSDFNGEEARAVALGNAASQIVKSLGYYPEYSINTAECFGDCGAVNGILAICDAVRSFQRGYANGERALVLRRRIPVTPYNRFIAPPLFLSASSCTKLA